MRPAEAPHERHGPTTTSAVRGIERNSLEGRQVGNYRLGDCRPGTAARPPCPGPARADHPVRCPTDDHRASADRRAQRRISRDGRNQRLSPDVTALPESERPYRRFGVDDRQDRSYGGRMQIFQLIYVPCHFLDAVIARVLGRALACRMVVDVPGIQFLSWFLPARVASRCGGGRGSPVRWPGAACAPAAGTGPRPRCRSLRGDEPPPGRARRRTPAPTVPLPGTVTDTQGQGTSKRTVGLAGPWIRVQAPWIGAPSGTIVETCAQLTRPLPPTSDAPPPDSARERGCGDGCWCTWPAWSCWHCTGSG